MKTAVFGAEATGEDLQRIINSPQFVKGRFRNQGRKRADMTLSKMPKLMRENNTGKVERKPTKKIQYLERSKADFATLPDQPLRITWFGHSAFLVEIEGIRLLFDPQLGKAAAPVPFAVRRFHKRVPLQPEDFPEIDAVIYTHDHYDHLDYASVKKLKDKVGHWITPLGVGAHLKRWGVDPKLITQLDWWEETSFKHLRIISTPNQHFSGRKFAWRDKTLWSSWVIEGKENKIFFNGDSGYYSGFEIIGNKFGPFDICLMECGQYHYMWKENHMTPEETAQAFLELKGKSMIPMHWGAFTLAPHSWTDPVERISHMSEELGFNLITPRIGESVIPGKHEPKEKWWQKV